MSTNATGEENDRQHGTEAVIPGALAEFLAGTNFATGADDADPVSRATRIALETGRNGRGRTRVITASSPVLDMITEYAETLLGADEASRAERRAAQTWFERLPEVRRQTVASEQEAGEQDGPAEEELDQAVKAIEQAEAAEGTWRGKWIGTELAQQLTLDGTRPDSQQGQLFH
ncbi:hypothetical protein ACIQNI_08850 [Streptomyces sp. NPDC091266]|uniref:hypothetical protein n=1 Tax=Streptomyces sp. NPDC091266 TaxID=3365978 RepID=UPI00382932E8